MGCLALIGVAGAAAMILAAILFVIFAVIALLNGEGEATLLELVQGRPLDEIEGLIRDPDERVAAQPPTVASSHD